MDTLNVFDVESFFASSQEIKREDLDIPLVPSPEEALTTKRKGTKRSQDPQEVDKRNTRRRENQKVACRNYRMRKKEYLSELKAKIQQLEDEKEQLTKENMNYKLNNNNHNNTPAVDPNVANAISEVARVLSEMQEALNMNDESLLEYLLQAFVVTTSKLHNAFIKDVDDLVNPFTQVSLASLGYMPSMDIPEISPIQMGGLWDSYITSSNLSSEQANKLREFITKVTNTDNELKMERGVIDNQIKQFYLHKLRVLPLLGNSTQPTEQLDTKTILEFTWLLNRLKTNIVTQKSLLLNTHPELSSILTPRQHATLIVNVCQSRFFEWPYHAQVLRTAWDYVSRASSHEVTTIAQHHPLSPLSPVSSPTTSPYHSPYDPSSPQYLSPPSPPTVVPSIAIPTPAAPFSTTYTFLPTSPSLTPTCTPQHTNNSSSSIVQSFLTSLNYGVH